MRHRGITFVYPICCLCLLRPPGSCTLYVTYSRPLLCMHYPLLIHPGIQSIQACFRRVVRCNFCLWHPQHLPCGHHPIQADPILTFHRWCRHSSRPTVIAIYSIFPAAILSRQADPMTSHHWCHRPGVACCECRHPQHLPCCQVSSDPIQIPHTLIALSAPITNTLHCLQEQIPSYLDSPIQLSAIRDSSDHLHRYSIPLILHCLLQPHTDPYTVYCIAGCP